MNPRINRDNNLVKDSSGSSGDSAPPVHPGDGRVSRDLVNLFVGNVSQFLDGENWRKGSFKW